MGRTKLAQSVVASCITAWTACAAGQPIALSQLADLPLEALGNIEVTSVSRRPESLLHAPASIYVITGEDIRRAGVTSLPEALRLAPILQVARIDSASYAISARGFNSSVANKLLVMVDGRTIYTPLFSGVFWDQQDLMLEDVERIEVISGPGGTLWGVNAVNGVINIITRSAAQTQGALVSAGVGNREQVGAVRFGGSVGTGHYRVYAKARKQDNTRRRDGSENLDARELAQTGFRADWSGTVDRFTLQGDFYAGRGEDLGTFLTIPLGRPEVTGANLLGRWSRPLVRGDLQVQAYFDHAHREDRVLFQPKSDIFDLEVQHGLPIGAHRLLWGAGYRRGEDEVADGALTGLRPMSETLEWSNVFVQGEVRLTESLELIAGLRLEHNDYTGTEHLPSVRLAWRGSPERLAWAALSRAVRAPSRFDRSETVVPLAGFSISGENFDSEVTDVYEVGYRAQAGRSFTYSTTLFRHEWDRLRSGNATLPLMFENRIDGHAYGLEGWAAWQATPAWRLSGGFTTLRKNLRLEPGSTDPAGTENITLAADPEYQWSLRSALDLGSRQQLDVQLRRVGGLPPASDGGTPVPGLAPYTAVDVRYAWEVRRDTELSVTVQNLQERRHAEFRTSPQPPVEIERSVFLAVRWES